MPQCLHITEPLHLWLGSRWFLTEQAFFSEIYKYFSTTEKVNRGTHSTPLFLSVSATCACDIHVVWGATPVLVLAWIIHEIILSRPFGKLRTQWWLCALVPANEPRKCAPHENFAGIPPSPISPPERRCPWTVLKAPSDGETATMAQAAPTDQRQGGYTKEWLSVKKYNKIMKANCILIFYKQS